VCHVCMKSTVSGCVGHAKRSAAQFASYCRQISVMMQVTDTRLNYALCANRLAVGYNLREMEAREEIKKRFEAAE
jgi:Protein of unknown function (DUF760)